jgi:uncharacterized protein involved in type VI secretion and phage assembly
MRQLNGVFPAVVIDNVDPENLGRIQVQLPQMDESGQRGSKVWARMATLMAGKNRGTWFIPDAEDEVLIAFEAGDVRRPYVIGSLWNGTSLPPETMDANNNKKLLRSRNGVTITLTIKAARSASLSRRLVAKRSRSRTALARSRLGIATAIQ